MKNFQNQLTKNLLAWLGMWLMVAMCTLACAQEREEDQDKPPSEVKDKDAAKRAKKAERKTRKEKKEEKSVSSKLPPAPDTPPGFEFFDGAIFSRKANLGIKNVLCFASERRPLAMLWREAGQEGGTDSTIKLSPRELQLIWGRPVEPAHVSVLNTSGQMLARGTAGMVAVKISRQPVYLLVVLTPSRPPASNRN